MVKIGFNMTSGVMEKLEKDKVIEMQKGYKVGYADRREEADRCLPGSVFRF